MKTCQLYLLLAFLSPSVLSAQFVQELGMPKSHHRTKLTIPFGEAFGINADSVHIDTLVMHDNSRIHFLSLETKLVVENAYIGDRCTWEGSGQDGANGMKSTTASYDSDLQGRDGGRGRSLEAIVLFRTLGSLEINTSGGKGGAGASGGTGQAGTRFGTTSNGQGASGENGSPGGNGGNGGALTLLYACDGFLPVFNEKRNHSITLKFNGGRGGAGGSGGKGEKGYIQLRDGSPGNQGKSGEDGMDGLLSLRRLN